MRVVVVGLGPAGRIAAHRAAARGWQVIALDPTGGAIPSTVGAWARQLPSWLPEDAVATRFHPTIIMADGTGRTLRDEYVVLDTQVLGSLGGFETLNQPGIGGVRRRYTTGRPRLLQKLRGLLRPDPEEGPSVSIQDEDDAADSGSAFHQWSSPDILIDATNRRPMAARQLAYGHIFHQADMPPSVAEPVLMDFRAVQDAAQGLPATFSYRIPLGHGRFLIEETILATEGEPAELLPHVQRAQRARLKSLGVDPAVALETEEVNFPLGPEHLPSNRPRTRVSRRLSMIPMVVPGGREVWLDLSLLAWPLSGRAVPGSGNFGVGGGWMHPATGYSVGAVLADVDRFLDALGNSEDATLPGGRSLYWLRRRGLRVLLGFDATQTREFFEAFFTLPDARIRDYLTGTTVRGTLLTMLRLALPLATRSPEAFLMLLKRFVQHPR